MNDRIRKLEELCAEVIRKFQPEDFDHDGIPEKTKCNLAVAEVALLYSGVKEFRGLLANQIYDLISGDSRWLVINGLSAQLNAMKGHLCLAAQKGEVHGHVAVILPRPMVYSSKWKAYVPMVANVGVRNGAMGCNFAFAREPHYFMYIGGK